MFDVEVCDEKFGCGEPLDGESAEYVVRKLPQPQEPVTQKPIEAVTVVMHAQCGVDAGFRQA